MSKAPYVDPTSVEQLVASFISVVIYLQSNLSSCPCAVLF